MDRNDILTRFREEAKYIDAEKLLEFQDSFTKIANTLWEIESDHAAVFFDDMTEIIMETLDDMESAGLC